MKNIIIIEKFSKVVSVQQAPGDDCIVMQYNNGMSVVDREVFSGEKYYCTLEPYIDPSGTAYVQLPLKAFDGKRVHVRGRNGTFIHFVVDPKVDLSIARVTNCVVSNVLKGDSPIALDSWDVLDPNNPPWGWAYDQDTGTFYKKEMPNFFLLDGRTYAGIQCSSVTGGYTREMLAGSVNKVSYNFGYGTVESDYQAKLFISSQGGGNKILVRTIKKVDLTLFSKITVRLSTIYSPYNNNNLGMDPVCSLVVTNGNEIIKQISDPRYLLYTDTATQIAGYHNLELDISKIDGEYNVGVLVYNNTVKSSYDTNNAFIEEIRMN